VATIKLDLDRAIGTVDRRIFGGFAEHLGRCIYGGIYDEGSPLSDEQGYRRDVIEAVRALRVPVLRWPGGNFVSGYHWIDGIGPVDKRPRRRELAWRSEESNRFGTDEFMQYCRKIGAEPYVCVNLGTGTLDEAQDWVEYCNGTGDTYWANVRRENGHPEPYNVRYWGLGNEMYGSWQIGALSADDYVKKAVEAAKVMKWTDPRIELISCGNNGWSDWDVKVVEGLARYVDYHSIHIYTGSDDFDTNVFAPQQADRAIRICQALIERVRFEQRIARPIYVAYDEWNVWYRARGAESQLEERYNLADALAVATFLNVFVRNCSAVRLANLAQLVNVIAPIVTSPTGLYLQSIYHPLRLYAEHLQEIAIDAYVDAPSRALPPDSEATRWPNRVADLGPFKLLDVAATRDAARQRVVLTVVNRDKDAAIPAAIQLTDDLRVAKATAFEVNGTDPNVINSFEQPSAVAVEEKRVSITEGRVEYSFPAHSVTVLQLALG
jgi:alpha-N-arabinofuranosidase